MKASLIFMPIATDTPPARLHDILREACPGLVVVDNDKRDVHYHSLVTSRDLLLPTHDTPIPTTKIDCQDPAYIIYTSGSTGEPKGVMVAHSSLANCATSIATVFSITKTDRVLQLSPYCFDPSLAEIGGTLTAGGTLCIRSKKMLDSPQDFFAECRRMAITILNLPTSLRYHLIRDFDHLQNLLPASLKTVVIGGEAVTREQLRHWYALAPSIKLLNTYGPTETTVAVTACDLSDYQDLREHESLIGFPIAGASLFVLDENYEKIPDGAVGELYIAGPGVSLGYFKHPDLTRERFLHLPCYSDGPVYKTGDRVKWVQSSFGPVLAFVGRRDKQIKIRGFRVELSEIEKVLDRYPGIRESKVLFCSDSEPHYLAAFIMTAPSAQFCEESLHQSLRTLLPDYMQPKFYNFVEQWPMTIHGKIDEKKLLATRLAVKKTISRRDTRIRESLANLWRRLLNTDLINDDSDFFALGGHSLVAMRLIALVDREFSTKLTMRMLVEHSRFGDLVSLIHESNNDSVESFPPTRPSITAPLTFAQEALYVVDKLSDHKSINYNIAYAIHLREQAINFALFEHALNLVIERQSILRTSFFFSDAPMQSFSTRTLSLLPERISQSDFEGLAVSEARTPFLLADETPFRVRLLSMSDNYHLVLVNHHHIIHDGTSIAIFLSELTLAYEALLKNSRYRLPPLSMHYADYANRQQQLGETAFVDAKEYWMQKLANYAPLILPFRDNENYLNPDVGKRISLTLPSSITEALRARFLQEKCTMFVQVLAAFDIVFAHLCDTDDVTVATIMSTRNTEDDFRVMGLFINTVMLRQHINYNLSINEFLRDVKATILDAHAHRFCPLENITKAMTMNRLPWSQSLFDVMINFHARNENAFAISGEHLRGDVSFIDNKTCKFAMMIDVFENALSLDIVIEFSPHIYNAKNVTLVAESFMRVMNTMASTTDVTVRECLKPLGFFPHSGPAKR